MTPETRAARDQLAAFLALPEYASNDIRVLGLCRTGQSHYDAPVTTGELRLVLAALDDEPPSPPDTGKLCCCHTGQDCPACLTGRCHECPDNPERERDEDRGDDEDEEWGEDD